MGGASVGMQNTIFELYLNLAGVCEFHHSYRFESLRSLCKVGRAISCLLVSEKLQHSMENYHFIVGRSVC